MSNINKYLGVFISFIVSIFIYVMIFQVVNPVPKKTDLNSTKSNSMNEHLLYSECIENCIKVYTIPSSKENQKCTKTCENKSDNQTTLSRNIAFLQYWNGTKDKNSPDYVLKLIYILIWFALFIQITLLFFSFSEEKYFNRYKQEIVDASLNSPPILGVIGTIYSFAIYTTTLESTIDLIEGFKSSFFDAAFTTILAGFVYTINLYLKIVILKDEEE